ncbi:MAG: hypothetical protein A2X49_11005 [Lentisphaerae bacterium GWF2_52_8]|nr:MAG: hypothetical protein A2X49_11005 [Lentisphaerae bacterium GWF2_52_8]
MKISWLLPLVFLSASTLVVNADGNSNDPVAKNEAPAIENKADEAKPEAAAPAEAVPAEKKEEVAKAPEAPAAAQAPVDEKKPDEAKPVATAIVRAIGLYIPNLLLDLNDIISIDFGAGPEVCVEARITRYLQWGGAYGEKYFLAKGYDRQIGGGYTNGWNYEDTMLSMESRYVEDTFGSVRNYIIESKKMRLSSFEDEVYADNVRDFWELGGQVGWLFTVGAYIHPVEIADFLAGIFFIDLRGDRLR